MFITFEGINGSGKSTQAKLLYEKLLRDGYEVILTKEPSIKNDFCKSLRTLLVQTKDISKLTELFILYASRNEHIEKTIKPALQDGKIVICDRYIDSSYAYQCCEKPEIKNLVNTLHNSIGGLMPDITFFIDIPVAVSEERLAPLVYEAMVKGEGYKKYDELATSHMQKIVDTYKQLATENKDRITTIDGTQSINKISDKIYEIVKSKR